MTKIVINDCFGGFSVSLPAARRMAELGHEEAAKEVARHDEKCAEFAKTGINSDWLNSEYLRTRPPEWYGYIGDNEGRADPVLVQVVEEMGAVANGSCAHLKVVEIPDGVSWHIEEYDGNEHVAEDHRTWR